MPTLKQVLFASIQYPLPHHALSRLMGRLTHCRIPWVKNLLIKGFVWLYDINLDEAISADPNDYACFNDFFTRGLRPQARPLCNEPDKIVSPADGFISQLGNLTGQWLIQAKGKDFSCQALLGGDAAVSRPFEDGEFATIYLSPRDYHRLHMPVDGTLKTMIHIPGRLFSVNQATTNVVDGLFARNERVVCVFDTQVGPMALVLVGALFVASIETVWHGVVTPPTGHEVRRWHYEGQNIQLRRGEEMGRFNMGSTIIVLFGKEAVQWLDFKPGQAIQMGQPIGSLIMS